MTTYFCYDGQNVVAEYEWDFDLLRYYVHGSTYIDERAILHDAVNDEEYYYALRELYTVEALLNNRAHEVERYTYDAYGLPTISILSVYDVDFDGDVDSVDYSEIGDYDGTNPCQVGPIYDTNGDGIIDYTDRPSGQRYPPGIVSSPTSGVGNPYAFTGRRMDHLDNFGLLLYHYRAREYDPFHGRFLQRDPAGYVDGGNLYEYVSSDPLFWTDPYGRWEIEWEGCWTDKQKKAVTDSFVAVNSRIIMILRELDASIQDLKECPDCYGELLEHTRHVRKVLQGIRTDYFSKTKNLEIYQKTLRKGVLATALDPYLSDRELTVSTRKGEDFFGATAANRFSVMFHELSHFRDTQDKGDWWQNAHDLDDLAEKSWAELPFPRLEKIEADKKKKAKECRCPNDK